MTTAWCRGFVAALLVAVIPAAALACGYCIEDKMAAVYDHAVVTRAIAQGHQVVFFAVQGQMSAGDASRRKLEAIVDSVAGVDKGSVRVSVESASLSVAFNPARAPFAGMERALSRKLAAMGLSVAILRVMDEPASSKPVAKR
jgi:hypothetical protein